MVAFVQLSVKSAVACNTERLASVICNRSDAKQKQLWETEDYCTHNWRGIYTICNQLILDPAFNLFGKKSLQ